MTKFLGLAAFLVVAISTPRAWADHAFDVGTGGTWDCTKDPEVTINTSGGTYALTGVCSSISINGSSNEVTVVRSTEISVNGAKNTVKIAAVDKVSVNGNGNAVTYKNPVTAKKTSVSSNGKNAIKRDPKLVVLNVTPDMLAAGGDTVAKVTDHDPSSDKPATDVMTIDCNETKTVTISKATTKAMISGTCDKVTVASASNQLDIAATKNLTVTGASNTIDVGKVDKIATTGAKNTIRWSGGLTGTAPKVATTGKGNTVAKVDLVVGIGNGSSPATGGAATIDCNKTPTRSFDDNGGSFTFTGACDVIALNGNDITIKVESIKRLAIPGNHNTVDATAVETISVSGNTNTVRYKKALGTKAKIANSGNGNTITLAK